jgi:uncharacterized protein YjbJ (UPF0337 family)
MQIGTIDVNKLRGVADKSVGLSKEFVGVLVGSDRLQEAGETQQERATAELKALREQLRAEKDKAKAEFLERRQRAAEHSKNSYPPKNS